MDSVIFFGTAKSGSSREAIRAAAHLGYFTILLTHRGKPLQQREEYPDVHEMIFTDFDNEEQLAAIFQRLKQQGKRICSVVSFIDPLVTPAARWLDRLYPGRVSSHALSTMEDKILTRRHLQASEFNPKFIVLQRAEDLQPLMRENDLSFPIIVKSANTTASRGVQKAEHLKQAERMIRQLQRQYRTDQLLIEEYLEGPQYLVEAIVYRGQIYIMAIVEQEILQKPRFIVTGYALYSQPQQAEHEEAAAVTNKLIERLQLENGACHIEWRKVRGGWKCIEINPRISGGAMNRMIKAARGTHLVKETLRVYLGQSPQLQAQHHQYVFTQYLTLNQSGLLDKVTGRNRALQQPGVIDVFIKPRKGAFLTPPLSMGQRYAYVMAVSQHSMQEARERAKSAAREITFHLFPKH